MAKKRRIPISDDREVLTLKEVSKMLNVHPITLYRMSRAGKLPCFQVGSDWRFRRDALERWIAEQSKFLHVPGRRGPKSKTAAR